MQPPIARKALAFSLGWAIYLAHLHPDAWLQAMEAQGYKQDYRKTDITMGIGLLAIFVTCLAQFFPGKWPKNFWLSVS